MAIRENPIGLIHAPEHVLQAIQAELEHRPHAQRKVWPFRFMAVGEAVLFARDFAPKAQIMAHIFGRLNGQEFVTKSKDHSMRVQRVK